MQARIAELESKLVEKETSAALYEAQARVLRLLSVGASMEGVLRELVLALEEQVPGMIGSVLIIDTKRNCFRHGAGPSLPREFNERIDGAPIGEALGACGTAVEKRKITVTEDVQAPGAVPAAAAPHRDLLLLYGLRSKWCQPVFSSAGTIIGAVAVYFRRPRVPNDQEVRLLEQAAQLASIIIEHKVAEGSLRASEDRFRNIVEVANEGVWTFDDSLRTSFVNRKLEEMLGYEAAEMASTPLQQYVKADERDAVRAWFERCRSGAAERRDVELTRKDGSSLRAILSLSPSITPDGKFQGALAMVIDISDRRRAEEMMVRASRMEATATLAAGVAHDFNNLMVGVLGGSEILRNQLTLTPEVARTLDMITQGGRKAGELAHQLLAFARGGKYWPQPMHLNDAVREALNLQGSSRPAQVRIETKLAPDLEPIHADLAQIAQVVVTLCLNAFEAIRGDGSVVIETRALAEGSVLPGSGAAAVAAGAVPKSALLCIRDSGVGIEARELTHIFEPFYSTKGRGRGLGLAAVFGIVHNHGGRISVESAPGRGTTFYVAIPTHVPRAGASVLTPIPIKPAEPEQIEGGNETILVVDDEAMVLDVTEMMLAQLGYRVLRATGGRLALELARELGSEIDLVVLDLGMPDLSGADTFAALRKETPGLDVLICSGFEFDNVAQSLIDQGSVGFVHKPFQLKGLAAAVRRGLKKRSSKPA